MAIFNLYSKRQKLINGDIPDILEHAIIPEKLRNQVLHIIFDSLGKEMEAHSISEQAYKEIHDILCREYGRFKLIEGRNYRDRIQNFVLHSSTEQCLDIIELSFRFNKALSMRDYRYRNVAKLLPEDAVTELNERFKENGIGYTFIENEIIRIDSTFIHKEIVLPAIKLLHQQNFKGANDEYLSAHEHYRQGKNKECLNDCLKAFESTIKTILNKLQWEYKATDNAGNLLTICFEKKLIPSYAQNQFTSLKTLLVSGVPTLRNKLGGHGQGEQKIEVPDYIARYALNLTGSNIILLFEISSEFNQKL